MVLAAVYEASLPGSSPPTSSTTSSIIQSATTYISIRGTCGVTTVPQNAFDITPINLTGVTGYAYCFSVGIQGSTPASLIGPFYLLTPADYGFNGGPNFTINTMNGGTTNHTDPSPWRGFAKLSFLFWTYTAGTEHLKLVVRNGPTVTFVVQTMPQSTSTAQNA